MIDVIIYAENSEAVIIKLSAIIFTDHFRYAKLAHNIFPHNASHLSCRDSSQQFHLHLLSKAVDGD